MIRLNFSEDFYKYAVIDDIYTRLSQEIWKNYNLEKIYFHYKNRSGIFESKEMVKDFLMSKEFYEYKFDHGSDFMNDLLKLPGQVKIKNIKNDSSSSERVIEFIKKYPREKYRREYERLNSYKKNETVRNMKDEGKGKCEKISGLTKIFNYNKLSSESRHALLNEMNISVCPYCNMNYTIGFLNKKGKRSTADIDHFYLKSEFPEYALCLYNFIPSCPVCNRTIKTNNGMEIQTHLYPYEEGLEDYDCYFVIKNLLELKICDEKKVKIKLTNPHSEEKVKNTIKDLKLYARYGEFDGYAKEIFEKAEEYNEIFLDSISENMNDLFENVELKDMIFGPELKEKDYINQSLAKFKHDILHQLMIY